MTNRKIAGIVTAVIGLCAIIAFLNAGMGTSVLSWPLEAYLGVTFTIVFYDWRSSMVSLCHCCVDIYVDCFCTL